MLSLQRALLGNAHPDLRQASIESNPDAFVVAVRFEYDDSASEPSRESCSIAAAEVIADFPAPWRLDEQHVVVASTHQRRTLTHVAYRRWEQEHEKNQAAAITAQLDEVYAALPADLDPTLHAAQRQVWVVRRSEA